MRNRRHMARHFRGAPVAAACAVLLAMLAGCGGDLAAVQCTSNAQCARGTCEGGICVFVEDVAPDADAPGTDAADDGGSDVAADTVNDDADTANDVNDAADGSDTANDADADPHADIDVDIDAGDAADVSDGDSGPPPPDPIPSNCDTVADCEDDEVCAASVCVAVPTAPASLAEEWREVVDEDGELVTIGYVEERPDAEVMIECLTDDSLFTPVDAPAAATLHGQVELFGSGSRTSGLCVSAWREEALIPWLVNSPCFELEDDDDAFVACFQLDPCRCDQQFGDGFPDSAIEDMVDAMAEARGTTIDSVETCYAAIGFCDAIDDGALRAACAEDVGAIAPGYSSVGLGHVVSVANAENLEAALFEMSNVPTNVAIAVKVSGVENRWIDTWQYGLFTRGDLVRAGRMRLDAHAVGASVWRTIPPAAGFPGGIEDVNGAALGVIRDCGSADRAPFNVVDATAGLAESDSDTRIVYFNGNPNDRLPANGRTGTNLLGLFAAINLPSGPNRAAAAMCTDNCGSGAIGEPVHTALGSRALFQTPKSVVFVAFEGARPPAE